MMSSQLCIGCGELAAPGEARCVSCGRELVPQRAQARAITGLHPLAPLVFLAVGLAVGVVVSAAVSFGVGVPVGLLGGGIGVWMLERGRRLL